MDLEQARITLIGDWYEDFRNSTVFDPKRKIRLRDVTTRESPVKRIVFHCTDSEGWSPERLSSFFVYERGFGVCAYHYYATESKIYYMVGENIITSHAGLFNPSSVAFSIGYFASRDEKLNISPRKELLLKAQHLAAYLCLKFKVEPLKTKFIYAGLVGHRELPGTGFYKNSQDQVILRKICPGLAIDLDIFRYNVSRLIQSTLNGIKKPDQTALATDGIFGPATRARFNSA